ncbi:DotG/IcmE/VirB10 family protein [Xanthobacter sp. DSM 14520]|uniref:DotG/IcmE/VirB10 family protein n=1 Tax=Xanthobacter autotrophicus (strain ATCC BAA-1158 / Py2) TaxID=78245 RepID=UPI00372B77B5
MKLGKLKIAGAAAAVVVAFATVFVLTDRKRDDLGGVASSKVAGGAPVAKNDTMAPVSPSEASKRATTNAQSAEAAQVKERSYVAPPVIMATEGPRRGDDLAPPAPPAAAPSSTAAPVPPVQQQPTYASAGAQQGPTIIYAYPQPLADQELRKRVESQITSVLKPMDGGFVLRSFQQPAPAPAAGAGIAGSAGSAQVGRTAGTPGVLAARSGDVAYATLDRGFNSIDPQAPIFATIFDYREGQAVGPLHGARVLGQITYNREQAAVTFSSLIMPSGYQVPIKGIGITETDGRTGVAQNVDYHYLERYSGLLVAGLIQGAGQVGQQLVQNNQGYVVTGTGTYVSNSSPTTLLQAGLAALQPVGNALSNAAAQQFNKPNTISSPPAMGLGIVFIEPLQIPIDQIQRSAAITRAAETKQ